MKKFEIKELEIVDDYETAMVAVVAVANSKEYHLTLQQQDSYDYGCVTMQLGFSEACDDDKELFVAAIAEDGDDQSDVEKKLIKVSKAQELFNNYVKKNFETERPSNSIDANSVRMIRKEK